MCSFMQIELEESIMVIVSRFVLHTQFGEEFLRKHWYCLGSLALKICLARA